MNPMSEDITDAPAARVRQKIWDAPTRLFHWAIVLLFVTSWITGEKHDMDWHRLAGYAITGLLIFRLYWGFAGSRTARFSHFIRGPIAVMRYGRSIMAGTPPTVRGHNPMGGWSVLAMLAALVVMVTMGLFAVDIDGIESGPLSYLVSFDQGRLAAAIHHWCFNVLLGLSALHILTIFFYFLRFRMDLVSPMLRGGKWVPAGEADGDLPMSVLALFIGAVLAGGLAYAISKGFEF